MPKITFIAFVGRPVVVDVQLGQTLRDAALDHGVPGIYGDCGGAGVCATCHVHVDEAWRKVTGEASPEERAMLEVTDEVSSASRLACQIKVSEAMDGMVVRVPVE